MGTLYKKELLNKSKGKMLKTSFLKVGRNI